MSWVLACLLTMQASAFAQDAGVVADAAVGDSQAAPAAPWASAVDVAGPSFLDTTDHRIRDDRPAPTVAQVQALRELEAEVDRFARAGESYRGTIRAILQREYLQRRRDTEQGFARQIAEEERLQNEARERAIRLFERFVRRYPDDPTYTPDAMFRLGELYYERSAIQFQENQVSEAFGGDSGTPDLGHADYTPTIELYRQLTQHFPNYRRIDGVYYLIGYCLNEMGEMEEARMAWLNLVCANRYQYRGTVTPPVSADSTEPVDPAATHPALAMDPAPSNDPNAPFVDPYSGCTPVIPGAEFVSETWLRIGEFHFDFDFEPRALERAISAYANVLANPNDRNYNLALYKVAWAYYRASRYPEAVRYFAMLIDWSDEERQRTGRAGSELRAEAVQYLGITFAYDDWNENQVPDPDEGNPTGIDRVQDSALLPQDKGWTVEVYFQLGQVYFDEAKYPQAIQAWELALSRWPNHYRAPEIVNNIARAHQRLQQMEDAINARGRLSQYGQGSDWWEANLDHPIEQRRAEQLAEGALINDAIQHHQTATRLRRRAVETRDEALLAEALREYNVAAEGYRQYIQLYPNNPNAYEIQYNLADALYWSGQYEAAAREYGAVRDSNLDDQYLSDAARRVVESLKRMLDDAVAAHQVEVRSEPPAAENGRVNPVPMPELVQRLAQAREFYLARVDAQRDTEHVRDAYDYNNALLLYQYGYWEQARERFRRIYLEHCSGPSGSEEGQVAWTSLRNMAVLANDTEEVERLATDVEQRACTFSPTGTPAGGRTCGGASCGSAECAASPQCLARSDRENIGFQRALETFRRAEAASGDEQQRLYEESATQLLNLVNAAPNHRDAPLALIQAALALERTSRFESASRLYQRVIDEVGPRRATDAADQTRLDGILGEAYFRLAFTANRFFDYDRAIENYRVLADSERFARSQDPQMAERRTDAMVNSARILEYQQDYGRAAQYYRRAAEALASDANEQRTSYFKVAEMTFKRRDWNGSIREMQAFIARYRADRAAGELLVTAYWRIAQARHEMRQTREYQVALQEVVNAYTQSGQTPGSQAAEYAAQARFELIDPQEQPFESFAIDPGRPATLNEYVATLNRQIQEGSTRAQALKTGYDPVLEYRRPTWTIAATVRQGRVYEVLARAILNAPFAMPADLQRRVARADDATREEVRVQVEDRVRQVLDQQVRPVECFAVERYALAARASRVGSLDNEYTRIAADRLQAYGEERIAECLAQAQQRDSSFQAYTQGEFLRARRGETLGAEPGRAAPGLAGEE